MGMQISHPPNRSPWNTFASFFCIIRQSICKFPNLNHTHITGNLYLFYPKSKSCTIRTYPNPSPKKQQPEPFYAAPAAVKHDNMSSYIFPYLLPLLYYFTIRILLPGAGSFLSAIPFKSRRRCTGRQYCFPTFQSVSPCSNSRIAIPGRLPSFS